MFIDSCADTQLALSSLYAVCRRGTLSLQLEPTDSTMDDNERRTKSKSLVEYGEVEEMTYVMSFRTTYSYCSLYRHTVVHT